MTHKTTEALARAIVSRHRPPETVVVNGFELMPIEGAVAAVCEALNPRSAQLAAYQSSAEKVARALARFRGNENWWREHIAEAKEVLSIMPGNEALREATEGGVAARRGCDAFDS